MVCYVLLLLWLQEAAAPVGLPPLPRFGLPTLDLSEVQVKQVGC
jgi:hypothetical protein